MWGSVSGIYLNSQMKILYSLLKLKSAVLAVLYIILLLVISVVLERKHIYF
jgi:hypothetical protein